MKKALGPCRRAFCPDARRSRKVIRAVSWVAEAHQTTNFAVFITGDVDKGLAVVVGIVVIMPLVR